MNKFKSGNIEKLKVDYYAVVGKLEITKNVIISDDELQVFESQLENCECEIDAASLILGATRRYKLLLKHEPESSQQQTVIFDFVETEMCEPSTSEEVTQYDPMSVNEEINNSTNTDETVTETASHDNLNAETDLETEQTTDVDSLPLSNSVTMVTIDELQLTTTRERSSMFIVYAVQDGRNLGCEFTTKKKYKEYDRFECKSCRRIVDKTKKTAPVPSDQNPAALKVVGGTFVGFIKDKHNDLCRIEPFATAYARSEKNACVQFKGKYGGTAKQCYEIHSRKLLQSSAQLNVTAMDVADGFKTFDVAKGALNKSNKRKSAMNVPKLMNPDGSINKIATMLSKTMPNEKPDYFLIAECQDSGTVVLGNF